LLQAVEFLSEYPMRYVERTQRDSMRQVTYYDYRDLRGDHPLVPLSYEETEEPELEAQSLYLVDRVGGLHLLRPLLSRRECPDCGNWATFHLDTYKKKPDLSVLKSMECGHTVEDLSISAAFKHIGLLLSG
jgi:hypothetical protein